MMEESTNNLCPNLLSCTYTSSGPSEVGGSTTPPPMYLPFTLTARAQDTNTSPHLSLFLELVELVRALVGQQRHRLVVKHGHPLLPGLVRDGHAEDVPFNSTKTIQQKRDARARGRRKDRRPPCERRLALRQQACPRPKWFGGDANLYMGVWSLARGAQTSRVS